MRFLENFEWINPKYSLFGPYVQDEAFSTVCGLSFFLVEFAPYFFFSVFSSKHVSLFPDLTRIQTFAVPMLPVFLQTFALIKRTNFTVPLVDFWCYVSVFTSFETANRYAIKNSMGQQVYFAFEESGMCMRQCCHNQRGFIMHIVDNANQVRGKVMYRMNSTEY